MAVTWAYVTVSVVLRFLVCIAALALAYFLVFLSVIKDWKGDLRTLDKMAKTKHPSETAMFKQFAQFVRSHSNVKELSE